MVQKAQGVRVVRSKSIYSRKRCLLARYTWKRVRFSKECEVARAISLARIAPERPILVVNFRAANLACFAKAYTVFFLGVDFVDFP